MWSSPGLLLISILPSDPPPELLTLPLAVHTQRPLLHEPLLLPAPPQLLRQGPAVRDALGVADAVSDE